VSADTTDPAVPTVLSAVAVAGSVLVTSMLVDARRRGRVHRRLDGQPGAVRHASGAAGQRRAWARAAPSAIDQIVHDLALAWPAVRVWETFLAGLAGVGAVVLVAAGLRAAVVAVGATIVMVGLVVVLGRGRRHRLVDGQLPGVVDRVGRSLQAGATLSVALTDAAAGAPDPVQGDLARVAAELAAGGRLVASLEAWSRRTPTAGVRLVVAAATLGHEAGGAQARALDRVAATLRERLALQRETRALASQARASAALLVVAPVAFAAFTAATDAEVLGFLLGTPVGLVCLTTAVGLDAVGALWMARLTREVG
jgi:tight adherence protein B